MRTHPPLWWWLVALALACIAWLLIRTPAHAAGAQTLTLPGYAVGEYVEPPIAILRTLQGQEKVTLQHLLHQWPDITVPVEALRLVNTKAVPSKLGIRVGLMARRVAASMPKNSRFLPSAPRVACAAFTSYILVKSGGKRHSYAVNTAYPQLRKRGARLVATRVSTRYTPYYRWFRSGDFLFFHKGSRLGHMEIYVGGGLTAGTSSSMLRVGIRPVGNRGYALMTVLRI